MHLIANGAFVQGNDLLETILFLQPSCPQLRNVDVECGGLRMLRAQKELTCKREWRWCVRGNGRDGETLGRWHEHGYFDEDATSGPLGVGAPPVERATRTRTLKRRIAKLVERWKRLGAGIETEIIKEKERGDDTDSDEEREVPPPYTAWKR